MHEVLDHHPALGCGCDGCDGCVPSLVFCSVLQRLTGVACASPGSKYRHETTAGKLRGHVEAGYSAPGKGIFEGHSRVSEMVFTLVTSGPFLDVGV